MRSTQCNLFYWDRSTRWYLETWQSLRDHMQNNRVCIRHHVREKQKERKRIYTLYNTHSHSWWLILHLTAVKTLELQPSGIRQTRWSWSCCGPLLDICPICVSYRSKAKTHWNRQRILCSIMLKASIWAWLACGTSDLVILVNQRKYFWTLLFMLWGDAYPSFYDVGWGTPCQVTPVNL